MKTSTRSGGTHAAPVSQKSSRIGPFWLAAVLILAMVCFLLYCVATGTFSQKQTLPAPQNPCIVRLDEVWTDELAASADQQAMKDFIQQTVDQIATLPGSINALSWSGRTSDGTALFQDNTNLLSVSAKLEPEGTLKQPFDAMQYLVGAAKNAELSVYLEVPGDGPDEAAVDLAEKHHMLYLIHKPTANLAQPSWYAGEAALLDGEGNGETAALLLQKGDSTQSGVVLGRWSTLRHDSTDAALFAAFSGGTVADPAAAFGERKQAQTLAVTYPQHNHETLYSNKVFLMGTSNPDAPLTLNGTEVTTRASHGAWGVSIDLTVGDNTVTLENGGEPLTFTVVRGEPKKYPPKEPQPDGSMGEEAIGKKAVVTDAIASALEQCWDSSSIQQTLYQGAVAEIVDVVEYQSGSKMTHGYKLSTGGYVRAATTEIKDLPDAAFTGAKIYEDETSHSTVLEFTGSGTPAVFHKWEGNSLTLNLLSAQWQGELPASERFTASMQQNGKDLTLTLQFNMNDPLYGWAVNYENGTTKLYFKHTPKLAGGEKPLTGITIMLDPGHGDADNGAVGAGGLTAPMEKDANLAVALTVRTRLEQLGATVLMTREDDSFPTLGDRVTALNTQHPDLFLSIHHNSVELTKDINNVHGTEAYWFYQNSEQLANLLTANLAQSISSVNTEEYKNRGTRYGYYYVTRSNICPATLLEVGFMANPTEYELCTSPTFIEVEAGGITRAIYQYLSSLAAPTVS